MSEAALKMVEGRLKSFGPKLQAKDLVTQDSVAAHTTSQPKTSDEAMEQALAS